ncbi:DUF3566 domain-containing protein [Rhodococcoides corynebacterioides]|uniref:DUF3566 domain-containing protein n=1 Tax=Rhodococcoides corynebacterioides TaxID=53972 RepID=UPI0009326D73|nr:DUF3566 domain-containing protein [Rhodococcus corynebacterioides]
MTSPDTPDTGRSPRTDAAPTGSDAPRPPAPAERSGSTSGRPSGPQQGSAQQGSATQGSRPQGPNHPAPQQQGPQQSGPQQSGPQQSSQQRQPQTNLSQHPGAGRAQPTGSAPTAPRPPAAGARGPAGAPAGGSGAQGRPDRGAAAGKAAVIDGPTRNIERKDLPTDMPDLSTVRHPTSEPARTERVAAVAPPRPAAVPGEPLRATVQVRKLDPWSMLKLSLVISVSLFFVWMVAVGLLYLVLDGMGVWDRLNNAFSDIVASSGDAGLVSAGQIFGYAAVIGLINVVLFTALTTVGSFVYNLSSDLVGGLEVTLADRD